MELTDKIWDCVKDMDGYDRYWFLDEFFENYQEAYEIIRKDTSAPQNMTLLALKQLTAEQLSELYDVVQDWWDPPDEAGCVNEWKSLSEMKTDEELLNEIQ
jgi:hypothetical protein